MADPYGTHDCASPLGEGRGDQLQRFVIAMSFPPNEQFATHRRF